MTPHLQWWHNYCLHWLHNDNDKVTNQMCQNYRYLYYKQSIGRSIIKPVTLQNHEWFTQRCAPVRTPHTFTPHPPSLETTCFGIRKTHYWTSCLNIKWIKISKLPRLLELQKSVNLWIILAHLIVTLFLSHSCGHVQQHVITANVI